MSKTQNSELRVGVIGLGAMGTGIAANLHQHGLLTGVWNRSVTKSEAFAQQYPTPIADHPAALAERCNVLLTCVSADADVLAIIDALQPALTAEHCVIDCSTIATHTAQDIAQRLGQTAFMDAPVSGGTEGARNGQLVIMAGGHDNTFNRLQPVFSAIGKRAVLLGAVGSGQATKAVNQVMAAGINQAVCEAIKLAEAAGLDIAKTIDCVGSGAAGNWFVNHRGLSMTQAKFDIGFCVQHHLKDLRICVDMADNHDISLPLTELTIDDYEQLIQQGYAKQDISALYRLINNQ